MLPESINHNESNICMLIKSMCVRKRTHACNRISSSGMQEIYSWPWNLYYSRPYIYWRRSCRFVKITFSKIYKFLNIIFYKLNPWNSIHTYRSKHQAPDVIYFSYISKDIHVPYLKIMKLEYTFFCYYENLKNI